jgi:serine protease AprX
VSNGQTINIPFGVGGSPNRLDGALWWPETTPQTHSDVDLSLINPSGATVASSISISSVFERARVSGAISPGTWTLRIRGFNVATQVVFWTIAAHQQ